MKKHRYDVFHPTEYAAILDGIRNGVSIDYTGPRGVDREARNLEIDPIDWPKVDAVIDKDVSELKKAGPYDTKPFAKFSCSPIGAVPKKSADPDVRKIRMIHHLSHPEHPAAGQLGSVNSHIIEVDMKISGVKTAISRIVELGKNCFLIKMDVEAAYKQIPVRRQDWPLLGFTWRDKFYYERVLPFGLTSSCRLWELYASALHWILRKEVDMDGMVHYVDDFLFLVRSSDEARARRCIEHIMSICRDLGIPMAPDKTEGPTFKLVFLGIQLDTERMEASLTEARLEEIRQVCDQWAEAEEMSVKDLQKVVGLLNFACFVIEPGRVFLKRMIQLMKRWEARNKHDRRSDKTDRRISAVVREDLRWWRDCIHRWNGKSFFYDPSWTIDEEMELYTDACLAGMGARWGKKWFEARWTSKQLEAAQRKSRMSMPFLEFTALVAAALTWGRAWTKKRITFRCDSEGVVNAIRLKSTSDPLMCELLRELTLCAIECNFAFQCVHVPGVLNVCADELSRVGMQPGMRARFGLAAAPSAISYPRSNLPA